jgi:hypothetical protein
MPQLAIDRPHNLYQREMKTLPNQIFCPREGEVHFAGAKSLTMLLSVLKISVNVFG